MDVAILLSFVTSHSLILKICVIEINDKPVDNLY